MINTSQLLLRSMNWNHYFDFLCFEISDVHRRAEKRTVWYTFDLKFIKLRKFVLHLLVIFRYSFTHEKLLVQWWWNWLKMEYYVVKKMIQVHQKSIKLVKIFVMLQSNVRISEGVILMVPSFQSYVKKLLFRNLSLFWIWRTSSRLIVGL